MQDGQGPEATPQSHAHKLFQAGIAVTVMYVGALAIYAIVQRSAMLRMKPDEFADFLAGVFAPLAFLWLVLGFRQQGDELQNSARALWLQGEELRNSVEQQRQLVEVSREQLEAEANARREADARAEFDAQPRLQLGTAGGSYTGRQCTLKMSLENGGPTCTDLVVLVQGIEPALKRRALVMAAGASLDWQMHYPDIDDVRPLDVRIEFLDARGNRRSRKFHVPVENAGPNERPSLGAPMSMPTDTTTAAS
jgi:hypothetical protein